MAAHPRDRRRPVHYDPSLAALQYLDQQQQWQALTLATGGGGGAPSGPAGGDLAGTYPNPTVTRARGLRDSGGTTYPMGAIGANELLQESGGDIVGVGVSVLLAASLTLPIFGTGIDGNVTLVANIGLTRSMNYNDLDLAGFTIKTNGHHLRVAGTLTGTGTIERDGGAALAQAGGVTDGGSNGPYGHGSNGSNGATAAGGGNGGAIAALTNAWPVTFLGGTAGKGGTGGTATNAGGVVSNPTAVNSIRDSWLLTDQGHGMNQGNVTLFRGGQGGSGGGCNAGGRGGGGGAGGGVVIVHARIWDSTCTVSSQGGAGAAGVIANGGGGGGGGGGVVRIVTMELRSTPTLTAAGGVGGAGIGTGTAGGNGNDGYTDTVLLTA